MAKSLIIADSKELSRIGLRNIFEGKEDVNLVGEAESAKELMDLLQTSPSDMVLIDYSSKDFTIDVVIKALLEGVPSKFIGITPYNSGQTVVNALKAGVFSHVKKDCSVREIVDSVESTAKNEKFFCAELVDMIRAEGIDLDAVEESAATIETIVLSDRELEIIRLIAEGYTNAQISVVLYISNHTVNTHRKNIMKKLGVNNTAGIVMYAAKSNLVSPNKFVFSPNTNGKP